MDLQTQMKQAVAGAAVDQIQNGMILGLGSGSTAALMIQSLAMKIKSGEIKESELMEEAQNLMSKMDSMPGMKNFQKMRNFVLAQKVAAKAYFWTIFWGGRQIA